MASFNRDNKLTKRIKGAKFGQKYTLPVKFGKKPTLTAVDANRKYVAMLVCRRIAQFHKINEDEVDLTQDQWIKLEAFLVGDAEKNDCEKLALKFLSIHFPG
jgi:hypothetical protein